MSNIKVKIQFERKSGVIVGGYGYYGIDEIEIVQTPLVLEPLTTIQKTLVPTTSKELLPVTTLTETNQDPSTITAKIKVEKKTLSTAGIHF